MAVLLALIPFFTWAITDVFGTIASRKIGNLPVNFFFLLFSFLLVSLYIPFAGPILYWSYFGVALFLGAIHVLGLFSYFKALEVGNASLVGAIVGSFSVVIVAVSFVIFKESLRGWQVVGVMFCIIGLLLTSFTLHDFTRMYTKKHIVVPGIGLAFVTFLAWGLYFSFIRIPVEKIGWFWSLYPATFYFLPLLFFPTIRQRLFVVRLNRRVIGQIFAMVVLGRSGDVVYNIALLHGLSSIVGAIAGISPVFFVILTRFIFKETLSLQQKIGITISLFGIATIAFSTI